MRIKVTGSCISADALRSYLQHRNIGYAVTEYLPDYTIFLDEGAEGSTIVADSIDCELERNIVNCISALTPTPVQLSRAGGVRRDDQIRITIPPDDQARYAVERGILRGLLKTTGTHDGWMRKIKSHFVARKLLLFALGLLILPVQLTHGQVSPTRCIASAAAPTYNEGASFPLSCDLSGGLRTSGGGGGGLTDAQLRASAVHILCDAGTCGGSSPFLDAAAFTFGVSGISNIGAVVDDVATNTVPENSAGTPRMNTNRILYMDLSKTLANINKFLITADPITFASPQHVITDTTSVTDVQDRVGRLLGSIANTSFNVGNFPATYDTSDRAARLLGVVYGSRGQQLLQTATNFNTQVEIAVGGGLIDPRGIRALTAADIVTAAQGAPNTAANAWPVKVTDGTNVQAVKAASTAAAATDPSAVIQISPNQPALTTPLNIKISQTTTDNDVDVTSEVPGTGATNLGKAEDAVAGSGDTGVSVLGVRNDGGSTQSTNANGDYAAPSVDAYGTTYARLDHPNRIHCYISSAATTSTLITGCAAPGAGLSIYVTDIYWSSSIISTTVNFMRIQSGTGGTCGVATTILYDGFISAAFGSVTMDLNVPIKLTTVHELCFVHAGAGTRLLSIQGFIAP